MSTTPAYDPPHAKIEPRHPRNWPAAALLACTLAIASVLLFVRVADTEIALDARVQELGVTFSRDEVLADSLMLSAFGIAGARSVDLPAAELRSGSRDVVSLRLAVAPSHAGSITLEPVLLPAGTRVTLAANREDHRIRLSVTAPGDGTPIQATVVGTIAVEGAGRTEQLAASVPKPVIVRTGREPMDLDLTLDATSPRIIGSPLHVRDVVFQRVERYTDGGRDVVEVVSTITSGTLAFESLDGQQRSIRTGERLRFGGSTGEIRLAHVGAAGFDVHYEGRVSGMITGPPETPRSLMPTWLDWMRARHGLTLLWGTAFYLFGVVAGVLRWWGVRV
jgi:hypothetical protein